MSSSKARVVMGAIRTAAIAAVVVCGSLVGASAALAQTQFFVGGSFGRSDIDKHVTDGLLTSGSVDGQDSGFKVFGGFQANPNFGLELAYADLGKPTFSGTFVGLPVSGTLTGGRIKLTGVNVAVVGTYPVTSSFGVFGKLGLFAWESEARARIGGATVVARDSGTDLAIGLGVSYFFTKNLGARAEGELFRVLEVRAALLTLGAVYRF